MRRWVARHPISAYFLLAYAFSWSIGVPLALQAQHVADLHLPLVLHYLTAFGPALAASCLMRLLGETLSGDRGWASPPMRWRWWAVGFASPLAMFAAAQIAGGAIGQPTPSWSALGRVNFLPDLGLFAWLLWLATSGTGEEVGWRGFLLPRLQRRHAPFTSSVLLAIGWAGWHLPAFFYLPNYAAMGIGILPGFFIGILSGAIVLTWLYNRSGGSVLAAILWHASFNFVTASPNAAGFAAAVTSTLVVVWAMALLIGSALAKEKTSGRPAGRPRFSGVRP